MSAKNLFRRLMTRTVRPAKPATVRHRPRPFGRAIELLEDRAVPATVTLTNPTDVDLDASSTTLGVTFLSGTHFAPGSIVTDVNVSVTFQKTDDPPGTSTPFNNEVVYTLTSPGGLTRTMIPANMWAAGATSSGLVTMTFDDAAGTPVTSTTEPTTGTFRPFDTFTPFNGGAAIGTWNVFIQDTVGSDPLWHRNLSVTVSANVPPSASSPGGPYSVTEGGSVSFAASTSTDGDGDPVSYSWDINGDGTFGDAVGQFPTLNWAQLSALGVNDGPGSRNVRVLVTDGITAPVVSGATTLTINNAPPSATGITGPTNLTEGQTGTYSLTGPSDPSSVDQASLRYAFAVNGTPTTSYAAASPTNSFPFTFPDNGTYSVNGRVIDKDGGITGVFSITVNVANVAPTVSASLTPPTSIPFGGTVTGSASFNDPAGAADNPYAVVVNYGDGTPTVNSSVGFGTGIPLNHTYYLAGTHNVVVTVTDKNGAPGSSAPIAVTVAAPTVVYVNTAWAGTPNGADPDGAGPAHTFGPGGDAFSAIQAGINALNPGVGGTVIVYDATYPEAVTIDRSLTLQEFGGAGVTMTSLTSNAGVTTTLSGIFTTTGATTFNGPVLVGGDTTLNTTGGNVTFNTTVNSSGTGGTNFQITSLTANNAAIVAHAAVTGDDRGGIALSSTQVFYTGDGPTGFGQTGRFSALDLSGGTSTAGQYDGIFSDLATETVYTLGTSPTTPVNATPSLTFSGSITHLLQIDGATGALTGTSIALSTPIALSGSFGAGNQVGIFAGAGRVVLLTTAGTAIEIAIPSGTVTTLGTPGMPSHMITENWAFWGVAERFGGQDYIAFTGPNTFPVTQVQRMRISDGMIGTVATFSNLSDMAAFTVSPSRGRWYFHHEGVSQFGGSDESIGYADATFSTSGGGTPRALTVNSAGTTAFAGAVGGVAPLASLTTDAAGTTVVSGAAVTTTGNQTYGDPVTLGADTTLTSTAGGNVAFGSTLNSSGGPRSLTVAPGVVNLTFTGAVGNTAPLSALTQTGGTGTTAFNGGATVNGNVSVATNAITVSNATVTTTGSQSLTAQNAVTLNAGLNATGSTVTIAANQDGAGTEGFTQTAGAILTTSNANPAVSVTVNTAAGGTGDATVTTITTGTAGGRIVVNANRGSIRDDNNDSTRLTTDVLSLTAGVDIGAQFTGPQTEDIDTAANTILAATTGSPNASPPARGIWIDELNAVTLQSVTTADGLIRITTGGNASVGTIAAAGTGRNVTVISQGSITVGTGVSSAAGNVTLNATTDLTVNGPVSAGGTAGLLFGQGGAGNTATIGAAVNGTAASVTGGAGADATVVNVTGTTTLTLNGAEAGDTYTVNYGALGTGVVAIADAGTTGTDAAVLIGTPAADTFEVNTPIAGTVRTVAIGTQKTTYTGTLEAMTLDGGAAGDTFNVQFANGPLPASFTINDSAPTGTTDTANLYGTAAADAFSVNAAVPSAVQFGGGSETVVYTPTLESLAVNGPAAYGDPDPTAPSVADAGDTFTARPDAFTAITINGGNPTNGFGDTLLLNVIGVVNPILTVPARPNGSVTGGNRAPMAWTSIETLPIPVGLGGQFDFSPTGQNVQVNTYNVTPATAYTGAQGYGWVAAPPRGFTGPALAASPPPAQDVSNLFRDGVDGFSGLSKAAVFRVDLAGSNPVQITAYLGDAFSARDGIQIDFSLDGTTFTPMTPVGGLSYGVGQYNSFSGIVNPTTLSGGVYPVFVRIWDAGGVIPNWALSGLEVRPIGLISPLAITRADGALGTVQQVADGLTIDTYNGTGADPGAIITINPGTATPGTPDARPDLLGFQTIADANGAFTFGLLRPTGSPTSTVTAVDITGANSTAAMNGVPFVQEYQLPQVRRIDFGPAAAPVAADEGGRYLGRSTELYGAANQLGWVTAPSGTFDRGGALGGARNLVRDGVFATGGTAQRDFRIDLPAGGAAQYAVTVVMGDLAVARDNMQVQVVTGSVVGPAIPLISTPSGQVLPVTFTVAPSGDVIVLRFSDLGGDPAWSLESIEVRPLPAAALPAPPTSPPPATLPPPPFQVQRVLAVTTGSPAEVADGTTASAYTVTGATPGALVTVSSPWGTFQGTDASPLYAGFQTLADSTGAATFSLVFPRSAGTLPGTITAAEVTGGGTGSVAFTAAAGGAFRYDMNSAANVTAAGWIGVRGTTLYSAAATSGYGWTVNAGEFDRGSSTFSPAAMYRDGNYSSSARTFRLAAGTGTMDVRVTAADPLSNLSKMSITVEGAGTQAFNLTTNPNGVYTFTGATDTNADGVIDVSFTLAGGGVWVANGIEAAPSGALPSLPQRAGFARPAKAAAGALTADQLAPIVEAAIARLSAGATPEQVAQLRAVRFGIADLDAAGRLGEHAAGVVTIDDDAFGAGWFIDSTPGDDAEFAVRDAATQVRALSGPAAGRADLLTVVMHELTHELGFADLDAAAAPFALMSETLGLGTRRLPAADPAVNLWLDGVAPEAAVVSAAPAAAPAVVTAEAVVASADRSWADAWAWFAPQADAADVLAEDDFALSGVAVG